MAALFIISRLSDMFVCKHITLVFGLYIDKLTCVSCDEVMGLWMIVACVAGMSDVELFF